MARTKQQHSQDASYASHVMWSGVADRVERLRNAHNNSPSGVNWHARRLFGKNVDLDALTPAQWQQVEAARRSYLKAMSLRAARNRRQEWAQRLREQADAIEAEVGEP